MIFMYRGESINPTTKVSKNEKGYDYLVTNSHKSNEEKENKVKITGYFYLLEE